MSDILAKITSYKLDEVAAAKAKQPLQVMAEYARSAPPVRSFIGAIRTTHAAGRPALIAEIKKASPSKGLIRADFDPPALARAYEAGGAACLSVLTDGPSFQGAPEYLTRARAAVSLPVLRKDFMVDTYQVVEARAWGADCILIIMAEVDDGLAADLADAARDWGMDAIVEVHDDAGTRSCAEAPLPAHRHQQSQPQDVRDHACDEERLAPRMPGDRIVVGESGIFTAADIARLQKVGVTTFLVGESLMRQDDVTAATRALLAKARGMTQAFTPQRPRRSPHGRCLRQAGDQPDAVAEGFVSLMPETLALVTKGEAKKGDVLATARIAGIMAAKKTHELIPLCHPLAITKVTVEFEPRTEPAGMHRHAPPSRSRARPASRWKH